MTQKEAVTCLFHTPAFTFISNVPARSPQSNFLQSYLFAASPAKYCLWERKRQMPRSACDWQSTAFTSPPLLTLALLLTVQPFHSHKFPWLLSQSCISIVKIWRQACLVICRSSVHTDTATTWTQVSSQVSDMGLLQKKFIWHMWKFKSLQRFLQWLTNSILAKPASDVFQWHGSFREDFWFSFIFQYLSHQSDIKSCTSFLQTAWRRQEENTNIWTTCEICLGD